MNKDDADFMVTWILIPLLVLALAAAVVIFMIPVISLCGGFPMTYNEGKSTGLPYSVYTDWRGVQNCDINVGGLKKDSRNTVPSTVNFIVRDQACAEKLAEFQSRGILVEVRYRCVLIRNFWTAGSDTEILEVSEMKKPEGD